MDLYKYSEQTERAERIYKEEKNEARLIFRIIRTELELMLSWHEEKNKMKMIKQSRIRQYIINLIIDTRGDISEKQAGMLYQKALAELIGKGFVRDFYTHKRHFSGTWTTRHLGFTYKGWNIAHKL